MPAARHDGALARLRSLALVLMALAACAPSLADGLGGGEADGSGRSRCFFSRPFHSQRVAATASRPGSVVRW